MVPTSADANSHSLSFPFAYSKATEFPAVLFYEKSAADSVTHKHLDWVNEGSCCCLSLAMSDVHSKGTVPLSIRSPLGGPLLNSGHCGSKTRVLLFSHFGSEEPFWCTQYRPFHFFILLFLPFFLLCLHQRSEFWNMATIFIAKSFSQLFWGTTVCPLFQLPPSQWTASSSFKPFWQYSTVILMLSFPLFQLKQLPFNLIICFLLSAFELLNWIAFCLAGFKSCPPSSSETNTNNEMQ